MYLREGNRSRSYEREDESTWKSRSCVDEKERTDVPNEVIARLDDGGECSLRVRWESKV